MLRSNKFMMPLFGTCKNKNKIILLRYNTLILGLFLVFSLIPVSDFLASASSDQDTNRDCETILNETCSTCHYKTRICQKLGKKKKGAWKKTINTMVRYGAKISPKEQETLLTCLSKAVPGDKRVCDY